MLTDPDPALAEQNGFVNALVGLAGLASSVRALGSVQPPGAAPPGEPDDFVYLLLGVVSLGDAAARLAGPPTDTPPSPHPAGPPASQSGEWLR